MREISRRSFVRLLSAGGAAASRLPLSAISEQSATLPAANQSQEFVHGCEAGGEYFCFSKDGQECIIHSPDTPAPWMNLLTNDTFITWITHRGYIECALLDRLRNGLTNPQETSGLVYVRDRRTGKFFCVNAPTTGVAWECRHGLGYTKITASEDGISAEVTYFVPRNDDLVVWLIELSSVASSDVDVFSVVEWNLGDLNKSLLFKDHGGGGDPFTGGSQFNLFKKVSFDDGIQYATQNIWMSLTAAAGPWPYTGYLASSIQPTSFNCVKQKFIGLGRSTTNPEEVEQGKCSNQESWSNNEFPWGVFHHRIHLDPGVRKPIVMLTGMVRDRSTIPSVVKRHGSVEAAQNDLAVAREFWKQFLKSSIWIETAEPEIDRTLNVWAKYQWRSNMLKNLTTGRYGLGFWSYGLLSTTSGGALTEVLAQPHDLTIMRDAVVQFLSLQYQNTSLGKLYDEAPLINATDLHQPWPPKETRGPFEFPHSHETDNIYPIAHYVLESGDGKFLDQMVPYLDGGQGTVFEHIANAMKYSVQGLSERGLPRLCRGMGDWNDDLNGLSVEGRAESVMLAMELCYHFREWAQLAGRYGRRRESLEWMATYQRIKDACNHYAWDGEWYIRAFTDRGSGLAPFGSSKDKEGRIFLNTQSLAVISGVAEGERARQCMRAVGKYLSSPYGPMLYAPAYTQYDLRAGIQSATAPGWRNANIYFRPTGWAVIAACLVDLPELAFTMYTNACLSRQSKDTRRYMCEPYVYAENVNGPDHPMAGAAQFQWNLGEGTNWMWRSYVYYILGVRPVFDGLCIDPRIPASWPGFALSRTFRNAHYRIAVRNPNHLTSGVKRMSVDGQLVAGNTVPVFTDGGEHSIEVELEP